MNGAGDYVRAVLVALLVVLLMTGIVGSYLTAKDASKATDLVSKESLAACTRHNLIRDNVNELSDNLRYFFRSAAEVRLAAAKLQRDAGEDAEASLNELVGREWLRRAADVEALIITDCPAQFPQG